MSRLAELERRYPEWGPWLAGFGEVLAGLDNRARDAEIPPSPPAADAARPLLIAAGLDPARLDMALLHAYRRQWSSRIPPGWARGYCPVCGAWPGFAELCGVERARFLRCVRCGSAWRSHGLSCPYCGNADHARLGALVEEGVEARGGGSWTIEVCRLCSGYLKVFTRLSLSAPAQALLEDLASVELDLVAGQRGYRRPAGAGYG